MREAKRRRKWRESGRKPRRTPRGQKGVGNIRLLWVTGRRGQSCCGTVADRPQLARTMPPHVPAQLCLHESCDISQLEHPGKVRCLLTPHTAQTGGVILVFLQTMELCVQENVWAMQ